MVQPCTYNHLPCGNDVEKLGIGRDLESPSSNTVGGLSIHRIKENEEEEKGAKKEELRGQSSVAQHGRWWGKSYSRSRRASAVMLCVNNLMSYRVIVG